VWALPHPGKSLKKSLLLTFNDIQQGTKHPESPVSQLVFSPDGSDVLQFHTTYGIGLFDIKSKKHLAFSAIQREVNIMHSLPTTICWHIPGKITFMYWI